MSISKVKNQVEINLLFPSIADLIVSQVQEKLRFNKLVRSSFHFNDVVVKEDDMTWLLFVKNGQLQLRCYEDPHISINDPDIVSKISDHITNLLGENGAININLLKWIPIGEESTQHYKAL